MINCPNCKKDIDPIFKERPDTPHAGEHRCPICDKWLGWKRKEKNTGRRDTPRAASVQRIGIEYCQWCLRKNTQLGSHETLTVHHIDEDPFNNDPGNWLVLCTKCHKQCHHERDYVNYHLRIYYDFRNDPENIHSIYEIMKGKLQEKGLSEAEYDEELLKIADMLGI